MPIKALTKTTMNFVVPLVRDDGTTLYAHASPISFETFEEYYLILAKTYGEIYTEELSIVTGPKVAALTMRRLAIESNSWDGPMGVSMLMAEIHRLTNVIVPTEKGFETLPIEQTVSAGILDKEDMSEVDNAVVFFTVVWRIQRRELRQKVLQGASRLWNGSMSSLNCTEFVASLVKSTQEKSTPQVQASSVPS